MVLVLSDIVLVPLNRLFDRQPRRSSGSIQGCFQATTRLTATAISCKILTVSGRVAGPIIIGYPPHFPFRPPFVE
jgi:hypothetical protein